MYFSEKAIYQKQEYGVISSECTYFNDKEFIDLTLHKPSSIKIFLKIENNKKNITGVQFFYRNRQNNEIISPGPHCRNPEDFEELKLQKGEYLNFFTVSWDTKINQIVFGTNKRKRIEYGEKKGAEMLNDFGEKSYIMMCPIGNYGNYLNSFGMIYVDLLEYYKKMTCGYFELKALVRNKTKWEKKKKDLVLDKKDEIILRVCQLPDAQFMNVVKYCLEI